MADTYPPRRRTAGCLLAFLLAGSVFLNLVLCGVAFWPSRETEDREPLETHLYGPRTAADKVAVVRADGPLVEGLDQHILRQIRRAGRDQYVKAVVLRVDS